MINYRKNLASMFSRGKVFAFDSEELENLGKKHHHVYQQAVPFQHVVLDNFLPSHVAETALEHFPKPPSPVWLDWKKRDTVHQPKKQGIGDASRLKGVAPELINILNSFNSYPFLNFLGKLSGIDKLLPDPHFFGGGLHQILPGGKLSVHTDFNKLNSLDLYRRINVLFFLNKNWQSSYNGDLELWSTDGKRRIKSIAPNFNRLVIFNTDKKSYHGHPHPLASPSGITRKSLAFYYYTSMPTADDPYDDNTDWLKT